MSSPVGYFPFQPAPFVADDEKYSETESDDDDVLEPPILHLFPSLSAEFDKSTVSKWDSYSKIVEREYLVGPTANFNSIFFRCLGDIRSAVRKGDEDGAESMLSEILEVWGEATEMRVLCAGLTMLKGRPLSTLLEYIVKMGRHIDINHSILAFVFKEVSEQGNEVAVNLFLESNFFAGEAKTLREAQNAAPEQSKHLFDMFIEMAEG